jgi:hypothetical protein
VTTKHMVLQDIKLNRFGIVPELYWETYRNTVRNIH